jgi:hypothetical protein
MKNQKLRKAMAKVPQEIKKQVEQAVLDLEDMRTWRYEYIATTATFYAYT